MTGTKAGRVLVWDLEAGMHEVVFEAPATAIARVAWLAGTEQGVATVSMPYEERKEKPSGFIFDLATGEVIRRFSCFGRDDYQTLATTPDGRHVVVLQIPGEPRGAFLIDRETGEIASTMYDRAHGSGPLSVTVASDSNTVAVGYAPWDIILWDAAEQAKLRLLDGHRNWVVALDFSSDARRLVSGAGDSRARVWEVETGKEIGRIRFAGSSTYVESVGFSPDGKLVMAASRGRLVVAEAPQVP
jgi:WD40 repeat protein